MRMRSAAVQTLRRAARLTERSVRGLRIFFLAGLRELAVTRTRLQLPRNQLFPLRASQSDGVSIRLVDPDEPFDRPLPHMPGEATCHPVFLQHQRGVFSGTYVAEIQNARIWGHRNAAILTADGRLIPELSQDMWGPPLHNIYTRARLPRPRVIKGRVLSLITPEAAGDSHHWLLDLLPRARLVGRAGWDLRAFDHILVKYPRQPFQIETLRRAGIAPDRIVHVHDHDHFQVETLVVPSIHTDNIHVSPDGIRYIRDLFLPADPAPPHRRLYLCLPDAERHHLVNEAALREVLHARGFEEVSMSGYTVAEQARLLSEAAVVVGPSGAAHTSLVFAPPSCHVVEFCAPGRVAIDEWMICAALGLDHTMLIGRGHRPSRQLPTHGIAHDIDLDPALLEKVLASLENPSARRNPPIVEPA